MKDMPEDSEFLDSALMAALIAAAYKLPDVDTKPLIELQELRTTSFGSMMGAIQEQLATPLIVIFDGMEVGGALASCSHMPHQNVNEVKCGLLHVVRA